MEKVRVLTISKEDLEKRMADVSADMSIEMLETTKDPNGAFLMTMTNAMYSAALLKNLFGGSDGEDE